MSLAQVFLSPLSSGDVVVNDSENLSPVDLSESTHAVKLSQGVSVGESAQSRREKLSGIELRITTVPTQKKVTRLGLPRACPPF